VAVELTVHLVLYWPYIRLEICAGMGMVGIVQNHGKSAGMGTIVAGILGDGTKTCGNTTEMEFIAAGNPWGVFRKCATIQPLSLKFLTA